MWKLYRGVHGILIICDTSKTTENSFEICKINSKTNAEVHVNKMVTSIH